ncbi:hypothetical protein NicSoilC5_42940 [Arthrobacter sp. NicSoilC5]|nr:hypothetical protein NicSoilC5_42940 [Arthrobacter sp. NicSoilC5]
MVNSVTPMPTPPMARAKMAMPTLGVLVRAAVDGERTLLICLLFKKWNWKWDGTPRQWGRNPDSEANPGRAGPIPWDGKC